MFHVVAMPGTPHLAVNEFALSASVKRIVSSVVTSKPANGGHPKTGQ
jgi:hypothetical protein